MPVSPIAFAKGKDEIDLLPGMANRHGLVAGATGTGKTVTLQTLAEQFSQRGVPVFMADVKGDLAGISQAGGGNDKVAARVKQLGLSGLPEPSRIRWCSGTCWASRGIRCVRRFRRWDRCC